jgi:hypothetical protein
MFLQADLHHVLVQGSVLGQFGLLASRAIGSAIEDLSGAEGSGIGIVSPEPLLLLKIQIAKVASGAAGIHGESIWSMDP